MNRRYTRTIPRSDREPICPQSIYYLYQIFLDLNLSRSGSGFGVNPISYTEMNSYLHLTGQRLLPWEVRILKYIDMIYLVAENKSAEIKQKQSQNKNR